MKKCGGRSIRSWFPTFVTWRDSIETCTITKKPSHFISESLTILQNAGGAQQLGVATVLYNMAGLYARQIKLRQTENLLRRSLAIWEATLPRSHASVARAMHDLGSLYVMEHKYAKAQPLLERLLAIREEGLEANDPKLEPPLQALAEVYISQRNYVAAEPLYEHLLSIQEKAGGPRNTEYADNLTKYAFLLCKLKGKREAAEIGRASCR